MPETNKQLEEAIEFANKKFEAVGIKNSHFPGVLAILQNEFHIDDLEVLTAAILHDTLEDTKTTHEELEQKFSKPVADLVEEVSHPKNYNEGQKVEFYKKLNTISLKAKIIKMADFADHLRSFIKMRKAAPEKPYHNQYILFIREFLDNYPESEEKNTVFKLTQELELYVNA
jgi:guanosine-3',5'-bis(diphosphate) 3'-pyrophosphohydrolase